MVKNVNEFLKNKSKTNEKYFILTLFEIQEFRCIIVNNSQINRLYSGEALSSDII